MSAPKCPKCNGDGYVAQERGGVTYAVRCECYDEARRAAVIDRAQIPREYRGVSLETFRTRIGSNPIEQRALTSALIAVRNFVREFNPEQKRPGLLLIGPPGVGKTHLAVAALREVMEKGFAGVFYNYATLLQQIRAGYDPASNVSSREAYETALDVDVLMLDDLGAHRVTDWVEDTVTEIITHRCNNGKPLIATTNLRDPDFGEKLTGPRDGPLDPAQYSQTLADRIGARAYSRLFEMCTIIKMPAIEDYRKREAKVL